MGNDSVQGKDRNHGKGYDRGKDYGDGSPTPYDDVFKTLLNDCGSLIIPVVNEVFHEDYSDSEEITLYANEGYLTDLEGKQIKRIMDSSFAIGSRGRKRYHIECESSPSDKTMMVRFFEYDIMTAMDNSTVTEEGRFIVRFPYSAVMYLRCSKATPVDMMIEIQTPGGGVEYTIQTIRVRDYTIDEIFQKKLYFLLPFYIFNHEDRFAEYEKDESQLESLKGEYRYILQRLGELQSQGKLTTLVNQTLRAMSNKVITRIAVNYKKIRKGVSDIMGGKVLDYEAKDILNRGIEQGLVSVIMEDLEDLGEVGEDLRSRINSQGDLGVLRQWRRMLKKCNSVDEFAAAIDERELVLS